MSDGVRLRAERDTDCGDRSTAAETIRSRACYKTCETYQPTTSGDVACMIAEKIQGVVDSRLLPMVFSAAMKRCSTNRHLLSRRSADGLGRNGSTSGASSARHRADSSFPRSRRAALVESRASDVSSIPRFNRDVTAEIQLRLPR